MSTGCIFKTGLLTVSLGSTTLFDEELTDVLMCSEQNSVEVCPKSCWFMHFEDVRTKI